VASLAEYDLTLYEDHSANRLTESLTVFEETITSKWFVDKPFILLLNKDDVFRDKIRKNDLRDSLPEYTGNSTESAFEFIKGLFVSRIPAERKARHTIPIIRMNAIEPASIQQALDIVVDEIRLCESAKNATKSP